MLLGSSQKILDEVKSWNSKKISLQIITNDYESLLDVKHMNSSLQKMLNIMNIQGQPDIPGQSYNDNVHHKSPVLAKYDYFKDVKKSAGRSLDWRILFRC